MEKSTSSKLAKESDKGPYCHSAYVNQMQSILLKYQVTESEAATRLFAEISTISDMQMVTLKIIESGGNKEPLDDGE